MTADASRAIRPGTQKSITGQNETATAPSSAESGRKARALEGLLEALPRLARDAAVGVIVLVGGGTSSPRALRRCSPSVMRAT